MVCQVKGIPQLTAKQLRSLIEEKTKPTRKDRPWVQWWREAVAEMCESEDMCVWRLVFWCCQNNYVGNKVQDLLGAIKAFERCSL